TLGRRVVVKVLTPDLAAGVSAQRFAREVRLAATLQHPHIVLHTNGQAGMARALAILGRRDEARAIAAQLTTERATHYVSADFIAGIYAALGDRDAAFAWLERGAAER